MESPTLLSLPTEILTQILNNLSLFAFDKNTSWVEWKSPAERDLDPTKKTLQSLRLSSHLLCDLATPLLFSVLRVSFSSESIEAFLQLCKIPGITKHVHGVTVDLAAYCSEYVEDFSQFAEERSRQMEINGKRLDYEMRSCIQQYGPDHPDVIDCYRHKRLLDDLIGTWDEEASCRSRQSIIPGQGLPPRGFGQARRSRDKPRSNPARCEQYRAALLNSYIEYSRRYRDQIENATNFQLVASIASAIASLPCSGKIRFVCEVLGGMNPYNMHRDLTHPRDFLGHPDTILTKAMALPHEWSELDKPNYSPKVDIVHLLTALPIAVDKAGGRLTELYLHCFPQHKGFSSLFPRNLTINVNKEKLRNACRRLRRFQLGRFDIDPSEGDSMNILGRLDSMEAEDRVYMDHYIGAAISSPRLHELSLQFFPFRPFEGMADMSGFNIRTLLKQLRSTQLSCCRIRGFRGRYQEILPLARALGPGMRILVIHDAGIVDGSWSTILDRIRAKVAARCQQGLCEAILKSLADENLSFGGELNVPDILYMNPAQQEAARETRRLVAESEAYISGRRDDNPLRREGQDEEDGRSDSDDSFYSIISDE